MPAPIALRLAMRQWLARPLRPILCSLAIAAAISLIICVGVAMDSLRYTIAASIGQVLGVAEVHVRPAQRETDARISPAVLEEVRALPEVELANGRMHSFAALSHGDDRRWFDVLGIDPALDERLRPKLYETGHGLSTQPEVAETQVLLDGMIAEQMKLKLGDKIQYAVNEKTTRTLEIVGLLRRPKLEMFVKPTIYVPLATLAKDMEIPAAYNVLDLKLKETAGIEDYDAYAKELGKKLGPGVDVAPGTTSKAKLTELTRTLRLLLLLLSVIAAICASLIIGTTLSVGIQERLRQFGQLRCIGASRGQLVLFLLADAAVMLIIGAIIGTGLGMILSAALVAYLPSLFASYQVSVTSIAIASGCGTFATLIGAAIPIWQVTRVSPMAAVTAAGKSSRPRGVWIAACAGVLCLVAQMSLWYLLPTRDMRFYYEVSIGNPMVFAGWALMAPALLTLLEDVGSVTLGTLFAVRPSLLRSAWSRTPWRAAAMIAALMIGVTLFTLVRARGLSLLASWTAPARIPDLIVKKPLGGFTTKTLAALQQRHPELKDVTAFDYFGVKLTEKLFAIGKILGEGDTTFIAVDPASFARMLELEYIQGNPATALKQLAEGNHVFVSKEYYNVRKLGVGDKIRLKGADGNPVEFTIAAVVTSTGVELVQNFFDLRSSFSEKATSSLLGSVDDGKKYFKLGDPSMLLADVEPQLADPHRMSKVRDALTSDGLLSFSSVELKSSLKDLISRLMDGLSVIAIAALCVASLGVANMVIASVHARRFEFGVLRAIGAGRSQLVRLVLAEVTLIGIVAGILGAAAGLHLAYMASQVDLLLIGFSTRFLAEDAGRAAVIAAGFVGIAIVLTTLLAWLASLGPAIRGATSAQRTLLASGRI